MNTTVLFIVISSISALVSGIGVKLVDSYMGRKDRAFDQNTALREELRTDNQDLTERIAKLEERLDVLRKDYWDLVSRVIQSYRNEHLSAELVEELSNGVPEAWKTND